MRDALGLSLDRYLSLVCELHPVAEEMNSSYGAPGDLRMRAPESHKTEPRPHHD